MKHKKGQCAIFIESRLPCEDCDLEGHSATCGWHIDWHSCSCEAFDKKGIKMKKIVKIVCSEHKKANPDALIQFQKEFNYFISHGVPAEQIVKTWNDSQDSFYNKVYLIEESK